MGTLGDRRRRAVERHVAGCANCAESVLALREIPAELARRSRPEPGEEFWARQRGRIMQVIESGPPLPARRTLTVARPSQAWRLLPALAVAAVTLFVIVEWLPSPSTGKSESRRALETVVPAPDDSVTALVDEPWPTVPDDVASVDDTTLAESLAQELGGANEGNLI
jgi:anti-sigma factor RsiW